MRVIDPHFFYQRAESAEILDFGICILFGSCDLIFVSYH